MMEMIGQSAGQIWEYLSSNGEVSLAKMKKDLDLKANFAEMGLGWLAREGKVDISKKGTATKVKLV
ncbi:MAG: winged helix-turn-helix domain-containing protein [Candidatus Gastranaerophilales bacterium]|nr:winged helix-turn-helix domain-containing protein [Candidatus Gastranaerophilales bacterium]